MTEECIKVLKNHADWLVKGKRLKIACDGKKHRGYYTGFFVSHDATNDVVRLDCVGYIYELACEDVSGIGLAKPDEKDGFSPLPTRPGKRVATTATAL